MTGARRLTAVLFGLALTTMVALPLVTLGPGAGPWFSLYFACVGLLGCSVAIARTRFLRRSRPMRRYSLTAASADEAGVLIDGFAASSSESLDAEATSPHSIRQTMHHPAELGHETFERFDTLLRCHALDDDRTV